MRVERLAPIHAGAYRAFMLRAYRESPDAFTSTVQEREALPLAWWQARVSDAPDAESCVLGAFGGDALVGVVGLRLSARERTRHKATVFGMVVAPSHRGRGVGRMLVEAAAEHARGIPEVNVLQLTVREPNASARRLYEACGFEVFGVEPLAVRTPSGFAATVHMWRAVR